MKKFLSLIALLGLLSSPALATPFNADAARHLISDGQILVHVDTERLTQSQTFKDLYGMIAGNPKAVAQLDSFKQRFGVDPLTDIKAVTIALNAPSKSTPPETAVYVAGVFKPDQIMAGLKKEGAEVNTVQVGPQQMVVSKTDASAFAFVKGGIVVANSQKSMGGEVKGEAVLSKALKGAGLAGSLKAASAKFNASKDVWVAFRPSPAMVADLQAQNPMVASFSTWDMSLDLSKGLHLHVEGTGTPEGAKTIADLANAQIAKAKASPQAAMLGGLINKANFSAQGPKLVVDIPLNNQDVKQLQMLAMMMMMGLQQGHAAPQPAPQRSPFPTLKAPVAPAAPAAPAAPVAPVAPAK